MTFPCEKGQAWVPSASPGQRDGGAQGKGRAKGAAAAGNGGTRVGARAGDERPRCGPASRARHFFFVLSPTHSLTFLSPSLPAQPTSSSAPASAAWPPRTWAAGTRPAWPPTSRPPRRMMRKRARARVSEGGRGGGQKPLPAPPPLRTRPPPSAGLWAPPLDIPRRPPGTGPGRRPPPPPPMLPLLLPACACLFLFPSCSPPPPPPPPAQEMTPSLPALSWKPSFLPRPASERPTPAAPPSLGGGGRGVRDLRGLTTVPQKTQKKNAQRVGGCCSPPLRRTWHTTPPPATAPRAAPLSRPPPPLLCFLFLCPFPSPPPRFFPQCVRPPTLVRVCVCAAYDL